MPCSFPGPGPRSPFFPFSVFHCCEWGGERGWQGDGRAAGLGWRVGDTWTAALELEFEPPAMDPNLSYITAVKTSTSLTLHTDIFQTKIWTFILFSY